MRAPRGQPPPPEKEPLPPGPRRARSLLAGTASRKPVGRLAQSAGTRGRGRTAVPAPTLSPTPPRSLTTVTPGACSVSPETVSWLNIRVSGKLMKTFPKHRAVKRTHPSTGCGEHEGPTGPQPLPPTPPVIQHPLPVGQGACHAPRCHFLAGMVPSAAAEIAQGKALRGPTAAHSPNVIRPLMISGDFCMSLMAAMGRPQLATGPQKCYENEKRRGEAAAEPWTGHLLRPAPV